MPRKYTPFFLCLLICAGWVSQVNAQPRLYGCSRAGFESYPKEENHLIIKYLDDARTLADGSLKLLAGGQIDELYAGMEPSIKERFRQMIADNEKNFGKVLDYEYRSQSVTYADPSNLQLRRMMTNTTYSVRTNMWKDDSVAIVVHTAGSVQALTRIEMYRFDDTFPVEKRFPKLENEHGCPFTRGPLIINP